MAERIGITRHSDKFTAKYKDVWLRDIGITNRDLIQRLGREFQEGEIEITDEMREALKSP